ncbi:hypothetical protein AVEN_14175-1, partial [Araneus ventricosus]
ASCIKYINEFLFVEITPFLRTEEVSRTKFGVNMRAQWVTPQLRQTGRHPSSAEVPGH